MNRFNQFKLIMNDETIAVIDVEPEDGSKSIQSIQQNWISAQEALHQSRLSKSAFQRALSELTKAYFFPIDSLRRGGARNTQYSQAAIRAISLLKRGKSSELEELRGKVTARSASIVHVEQHSQIARIASAEAGENLMTISSEIGNLMSKFERLGEALGDQAAGQIEAGFTRKVAQAIKKLTEV